MAMLYVVYIPKGVLANTPYDTPLLEPRRVRLPTHLQFCITEMSNLRIELT